MGHGRIHREKAHQKKTLKDPPQKFDVTNLKLKDPPQKTRQKSEFKCPKMAGFKRPLVEYTTPHRETKMPRKLPTGGQKTGINLFAICREFCLNKNSEKPNYKLTHD